MSSFKYYCWSREPIEHVLKKYTRSHGKAWMIHFPKDGFTRPCPGKLRPKVVDKKEAFKGESAHTFALSAACNGEVVMKISIYHHITYEDC
jgi:hypothetical protein